ncbi:MAG: HD domain-containing protein [Bacteroidota bacterium]
MNLDLFELLKNKYIKYVDSFEQSEELIQKKTHSLNVSVIARQICEFVVPSTAQQLTTEIAALYHDIGRFEQLLRYKTFNDWESEDHALLGINVIKNNNLFDGLDNDEQEIIFTIIENHNKKQINQGIISSTATLCNVIRDADKIDILHILSKHYESKTTNNTLTLNLPDSLTYNTSMIKTIMNAEIGSYQDLKSINDFKLLQLSWVFDINFAISHVLIHQAKYFESIYNSINIKSPEIDLAYSMTYGINEAFLH